jgi:hypothetical protein
VPKQHHVTQPFEKGQRPQITLVPVESRQVAAIGYDKDSATLAVSFKRWDGGVPTAVYHYENVSPVVHAEFIGAESIGKYFGEHIKALPFKKYVPEAEPATTADASA